MEYRYRKIMMASVISLITLVGCNPANQTPQETENQNEASSIFKPHEDLNQSPIPIEIDRVSDHKVMIKMTAQITDIEIEKDKYYKAWTFNGEAPGPLIVVNEGDLIEFTLENADPAVPHSMDFHAVHAAPSEKFIDVMPNETGTFSYEAGNPGVFMYHCGTQPILQHIANGMHGIMIVKPNDGYPTDEEIDREYVLIQNEWYSYNDLESMKNAEPEHVVFSTKALYEGELNTNGDTFSLKETPLKAKVGEKVRLYLNNVGPNETSSFHVVGTIFDDVYIDGNPTNHFEGMQTVMLPASGGAVVEFTVEEVGTYPIITHQFNHAEKGAVAHLEVTE